MQQLRLKKIQIPILFMPKLKTWWIHKEKYSKDEWMRESIKNRFWNNYTMQQLTSFKLFFSVILLLTIVIWIKIPAIIYISINDKGSELQKTFHYLILIVSKKYYNEHLCHNFQIFFFKNPSISGVLLYFFSKI